VYVRGLLGPGDRKSVEPLPARVAPDDYEQVHHFVCAPARTPLRTLAAAIKARWSCEQAHQAHQQLKEELA
jgi:hypothetical protein